MVRPRPPARAMALALLFCLALAWAEFSYELVPLEPMSDRRAKRRRRSAGAFPASSRPPGELELVIDARTLAPSPQGRTFWTIISADGERIIYAATP